MDGTAPTQEVNEFDSEEINEEDDEETNMWGRLFSISVNYESVDLIDEEYTFGRGDQCSIVFDSPSLAKLAYYTALSKVHFKLMKEDTGNGSIVYLHDLSSNGTFVNGIKLGKGKKQVLNNNDEISLAMKKNKAFVFILSDANGTSDYPEDISEKYTVSRELGRGACGVVRLVFSKGSCHRYAMKVIEKKTFSISGKTISRYFRRRRRFKSQSTGNQVQSEVKILKSLNHPCIIGIEEVIETPESLYIILELVEGGELFDRIISSGELKENTAKLIFYQMALAIKYLHDNGITHRDLKPENILLSNDNEETLVKVTDFGLSKFVDANTMLKTFCGTPNYLAPEILSSMGNGSYTKLIDVWSLGVILYVCLVGYPPFTDEREDMDLRSQILNGSFEFTEEFWKNISEPAKDLVKNMLTVEASKRPDMAAVLKHPWLDDSEMRSKAHLLMNIPDDSSDLDQEKNVTSTSDTAILSGAPVVMKRKLDDDCTTGLETNGNQVAENEPSAKRSVVEQD